MNPVEKYIFEKAMAHYGPEAQIKMLYEEMAELQLAVCKNGIMLDQMRLLFNVEARSRDIRDDKMARLAERMDRA